MARVNNVQIHLAVIRIARLLQQLGITEDPRLVRGDRDTRTTNKLLINRRDLFTGGTGGYTSGDLIKALAVMEQTLRLIVDTRERPHMPVAVAFALAGREIPDAVA